MNWTRVVLLLLGAATITGLFAPRVEAQRNVTIIPHPSWDSYMPEGIPHPESGTLVLELDIPLDRAANIGMTQFGDRSIAVGLTGSFEGPEISGAVMEGALDYALTLSNGTIEIEQIIVLQAAEGSYILVRSAGTGPDEGDVRVVLDFEAPNASEHAWLNTGKFVARRALDASGKRLTMSVYDVADVPVRTASAIQIEKPGEVPAQPWDYRVKDPAEMQGAMLIQENVTLGPSQSVGPSKYGNRNIIPITGGELSGQFTGKVLMGGADYQNLGQPATIDARYLWQADGGEIIIVRNAGGFGGLVPYFETRVDGPYAYLNDGLYLSSNPGAGQGGVSLTFYESVR